MSTLSTQEVWWKKVVDKNFIKIVQLYEALDEDHDVEFFTKLLGKDFDINYTIPDDYTFEKDELAGRTILQLSDFSPKITQILIDHGADYTIRTKTGSTHLLEKTKTSDKDNYADIILSAYIKSKNYSNPKDDEGLSHFHVACMYNKVDAVKFFLENGVPINETVNSNSNFYPGFSALHFAAKSCALQTVELLLTFGADMYAKDSKGMNPLHVLIFESRQASVRLNRRMRMTAAERENSNFSEYSNLCEYHIRNQKIIYLLLDKMKECSFYVDNDTRLSYFHVLCFMGNTSTIKQLLNDNREYLSQSVSNDSPIWPGYTPLHFAAHSNVETIEVLVEKGADFSAKDASGVTPFEVCLREFSIADVHRILLLQPDYSNIVFSDGKMKLCDFIYAMQDIVTFENFLKDNLTDANTFIPLNSPICAGLTALHLTIMCTEQPMSWTSKILDSTFILAAVMESEKSQNYLSRIDSCLCHNPNVTIRDARGLTPLHWAFRLQQSKAVCRLLERHETSRDYVDEHGLSHLHIACACKNQSVVEKLLIGGAKVNEAVKSNYTWLDSDTDEPRYIILERGNLCFAQKDSTPLHFATVVECPKIVEILIDNGADVLAQDADGLNPLERIFEAPIFRDSKCVKPPRVDSFTKNEKEIAKMLIRQIGDRLADTKPKQMLYCYSLLENKLLSEILDHRDKSATKILASVGITPLHVACFTRNRSRVNRFIKTIDVNARVNTESPLWPGCTPLHLFVMLAGATDEAIVKKLLRRGADPTLMNAKGETPIHQCFPYRTHFLATLLRNIKNFSVNPASYKRGFTHLHIASALGGDWIVEKLLQEGAFVDEPTHYFMPEYGGYTGLHLAVAYRRKNVVDLLIKHGADVNWRNACGGNSLHAAMVEEDLMNREPCLELLQTLIDAGADIHARNMFGDTPFEALIKSFNRAEEEVQLFLALGCRVNTVNDTSDQGFLAIALNKSQELPIFEIVSKAPDMKDIDSNGRNAIHSVVAFKRPDWESPDDEDIDEKYATSDVYVKGIAKLMKLGLNIDQQDCKGFTPLHLAAQMKNLNGIIGLLENGADINITDDDDESAFARSLELAEIQKQPTELDFCILEVISTYLYKLNLARIGICESNRETEEEIRENYTVDSPKVEEISDEIERMREQKINSTSVTFFEFLSDTGAVSAFPHMLPHNRVAIDTFFKNEAEILRENFPQLTGILILQYRKALTRLDMIDPAVVSFNILVGFDMPAICTRIILRYLSNDELNDLIRSTDDE